MIGAPRTWTLKTGSRKIRTPKVRTLKAVVLQAGISTWAPMTGIPTRKPRLPGRCSPRGTGVTSWLLTLSWQRCSIWPAVRAWSSWMMIS